MAIKQTKTTAPTQSDPRAAQFTTFGVSGLKRTGGRIREEFHPKLQGKKRIEVFKEMEENSPLLGGAQYAAETLVGQVEWRTEVDPKKDFGEDGRFVADTIDGMRSDMETTWSDLIVEAMSAMVYGFAVFEEMWKVRKGESDIPTLHSEYDDGLIGVRDIRPRSQDSLDRWAWDKTTGQLAGMYQRVTGDSERGGFAGEFFVPVEKMLLFHFRARKASPEGRSFYRPCYRPYHFLTAGEEAVGIGMHRILAGLPVMQIPVEKAMTGADQTVKNAATDMVRDIRNDALSGVVIPAEEDRNGKTGFKFALLASSGRNVGEAEPILQRHRSDMLIALLMQFLSLGGPGSAGSWSLASEMTAILAMALNSILRSIAERVRNTTYRRICRLNGWPSKMIPVLTYTDIEKTDTLKLAQTITTAAQAGIIIPDGDLEKWFRDQAGWPAAEPGSSGPRVPMPPAPANGQASRYPIAPGAQDGLR